MDRAKSSRKRRQPIRYDNQEQGEEIVNRNEEEPIPGPKRTKLLARRPGRRVDGKEVRSTYQLLRKTIGVLTMKVNDLSEEMRKTKEIQKTGKRSNDSIEGQDSEQEQEIGENHSTKEENRNIIYNIRNLNLERPKFGSKADRHPVAFLEDLESYLKKAAKEGKDLELIQECLIDGARDWARIYKDRWRTVEDFKKDFLTIYWGEYEQNELRRNIVHGKWDRTNEPSMLSYFLKITGKAQMLSHKIPEIQLVADVIRHYPKYVQQVWITSKTDTIIGAAEFLRSMDDISKQDVVVNDHSKYNEKKKIESQSYQNWKKPTVPPGTNHKRVNPREQTVYQMEDESEGVEQNVDLN